MNTTNLLLIAGAGIVGWFVLGSPTDLKGFKDGIDKLIGKKPVPPKPVPVPVTTSPDDIDGSMDYPYPPPPPAPYPPGAFGPAPYGDPNLQFDPNMMAQTQPQAVMTGQSDMGMAGGTGAPVDPIITGGVVPSPTVPVPTSPIGGIDPTTGLPIPLQQQQPMYPYGVDPTTGIPLGSPPGINPSTGSIAPGDPFAPSLPPNTAGIDVGQSQALPGGAPPWLTGPHPGMAVPGDLGGPDPYSPLPPPPPPPIVVGEGGYHHDYDEHGHPIIIPGSPGGLLSGLPGMGLVSGLTGGLLGGLFAPPTPPRVIPAPIHRDFHPSSHRSHYSRSNLGIAETRPKSFITPYNPALRRGRCVPFFKSIPELMNIDIGGIVVGLDGITLGHLISLGTGTGREIFPDGIDSCDMAKFKSDVNTYCIKLMKNMTGHTPAERADMLRQIILISSQGPITPMNSIPKPTTQTYQNMMSRVPTQVPSTSPPGVTGPVYQSHAGFVLPAKAAALQFNNGMNSMPPMIRSRRPNSLFFDLGQ